MEDRQPSNSSTREMRAELGLYLMMKDDPITFPNLNHAVGAGPALEKVTSVLAGRTIVR
jgi:hypothetical protein